jgi:hypothetical protein
MGRYYSGDIEGKFWFAVQSSDDASHFGGAEIENDEEEGSGELQYFFEKSDLDDINDGIDKCIKELGADKEKLDSFFSRHDSYNDEMIVKEEEIPMGRIRPLLELYARLHLGNKIKECVERTGQCSFFAEC